jgi:hypothetical protein
MTVTLIATTVVDWAAFIQSVQSATGRSPTRRLDERASPIDHLAAYIAALDCVSNEASDPMLAIRTANATLDHVSLSFAVETTDLDALRSATVVMGIAVITGVEVAVMTATLGTWKRAILEAMKPHHPKNVRLVFNGIFFYLKSNELGHIFEGYSIKQAKDKTFLLE